jgi:membrane fusion protein, multidrug efflux system
MKIYSYTVVLILLLASCGSPKEDPKAELAKLRSERSAIETRIAELEKQMAATDSTGGKKAIEVVATALKAAPFKTYIEIQGRIDADEHVNLAPEIPGTITRINVKVGDEVSKGQVLAETDARALNQQLAATQVSVALASQMYEKQKNLWDQKIGTEMQFLQTKAMKEASESGLAALQEQIRMTKIISPINGTVDEVAVKIGQAASPGIPAISVINFSNLKVKADVAESYLARVKTGNEALVLFPDMNDSIRARVHYASRAINPMTRTFNVEVNLDNKKEYHPNMVAKLRINDYISSKPRIVVPVKYIQKNSGESYVFVAENGKAVKKVITVGREYSGHAEIEKGLTEGELLITEGYDLIDAEDPVKVSTSSTIAQ